MTGYHITVGYQSGGTKDEAWKTLTGVVADLRNRPDAIVAEVLRVEYDAAAKHMRSELAEFASVYANESHETDLNLTLRVEEGFGPDDDNWPGAVVQLASGYGPARDLKELMRRAFCRLVIAAMHERGMEVNLHVY